MAEEFYRNAIRDWYAVSHVDPDRTFFTDNQVYQFGDYVIGRGRSTGQMLVRGPDEIRRSGLDSVAVVLDLAGMKGDADGRDISGAPGSIQLRNLARPSAFKAEAVDVIVLAMPRDRAPPWLVDKTLHGLSMDRTLKLSRLLRGHLMALVEAAPGLSVEVGVSSAEAALIMAEMAFKNTGQLNATQSEAAYGRLRASAVALIDLTLCDPELKIERLAQALGASRATLFRAFASSGGINLYIKHRRLERAREALRLRSGRHPSVAEIAHAHGFTSESHFSRSFLDHFGQRPGALEVHALPPRPSGNTGDIRYDLVLNWIGGSNSPVRSTSPRPEPACPS